MFTDKLCLQKRGPDELYDITEPLSILLYLRANVFVKLIVHQFSKSNKDLSLLFKCQALWLGKKTPILMCEHKYN